MSLRRTLASLLLLAGLCPLMARAQSDPEISVTPLSSRVPVGEIGQLFVKISSADAVLPEKIETPGLEVVLSGSQQSINILNGVTRIEMTYFYRFRGDTAGVFTIPAFEIDIQGKAYTTQPVPITIFERDQNATDLDATKPYFGKLELNKDKFYVNEIVPFTLTAYVRGRNAITDVTTAKLENESFVFKGFREVRTDGADVGNSYYSSAVIPSTLFALKPGQHRLGPAKIGVRVMDSSSGFGLSAFFQRNTPKEMATDTVNVEVLPLPDGAPASFTGGVGVFEISVIPSTTTVGVGDPISMEFVVTGIGNLRTMTAPVFAIPQTDIWKSYEANKELADETDSDGFKAGKVTFSRVIIPEAKTADIPPFALSYFDPAKAEYVTLLTDAIPITLTKERMEEDPTVIQFSGATDSSPATPAAQVQKPTFSDILHIRTGSPRWLATAGSASPGFVFYLVQALFSIAFFTISGFGVVRWTKHYLEKRSRKKLPASFARSLKKLPKPGTPRRVFFHAVSDALSRWREEHPSPPTEVQQVIDHLSDRCSTVLYSGMKESDTPVSESEFDEFQAILKKLPHL